MVFQKRGRDRLHIIAEILVVAIDGTVKTRIMYGANLGFHNVNEYLSLLLEKGLLEKRVNNGKTLYKTTAKGEKLLQCYMEIQHLIKVAEK